MIGACLLGSQKAAIVLWGAALLQLWYLLDRCDGEVARYRKYKKEGRVAKDKLDFELNGVYLDNILHYLLHSLIFASLSLGLYRQYGQLGIIGLGFSAALSAIFINLIMQSKDSIIFSKIMRSGSQLRISEKVKTATQEKGALSRIFSFLHYLCTFPFVINILTLCAVIDFLLKNNYSRPLELFVIVYGILMPFVWILKFLFFILSRRIDTEFDQIIS
jgi:hypothetical protein